MSHSILTALIWIFDSWHQSFSVILHQGVQEKVLPFLKTCLREPGYIYRPQKWKMRIYCGCSVVGSWIMLLLFACISYIGEWYLPNTSKACLLLHLRTISVFIFTYCCAPNLVWPFVLDGIGSYHRPSFWINSGICLPLSCGNGVLFRAQVVRSSSSCCDNKGRVLVYTV